MIKLSISGSLAVLMACAAGLIISGLEAKVGIRLRISDLFLLLAIPLILVLFIRGSSTNDLIGIVTVYTLYAFYTALNAYYLSGKGTAIKESLQLFVFFLTLMGFIYGTENDDRFRRFAKLYYFLLWGVAFYSAGYHILVLNAYSGWKLLGDQKLAYGLLVVLTFALHHERFFTKRSFTFFLMLSLAMLLLSGERKGWIAAIVGSLTLLSMAPHGAMSRKSLNRLLYFAIGFLALLAIVSVLAPLFPYLERQLTSTTNFIFGLLGIESELASSSNRDRLFLLRFGLQLFLENPFFGAGLDTFKAHIALLPGVIAVNGAHNEPLRIAAELGSVGLFLYMMLYVVGVFRILQIRALGRAIGELQFIKFRLATGLLAYGFIVNLFLAGGGVTLFLVVLPLGLLFSVPVRQSRRTAALPSSGYITQKMSVVSTVPSKWSDRD